MLSVFEILNFKEWRDLEIWVRGRWRSLEMALFDMSRTSSYWRSIVTTNQYIIQMYSPVSGRPHRSIAIRFRNNGAVTTRWWKKFGDTFSRFDAIPACDRQTDRQTRQHSPRYALRTHRAVKVRVRGDWTASCVVGVQVRGTWWWTVVEEQWTSQFTRWRTSRLVIYGSCTRPLVDRMAQRVCSLQSVCLSTFKTIKSSKHVLVWGGRHSSTRCQVGRAAVLERGPLPPQDHKSGTVCRPILDYVGCHTASSGGYWRRFYSDSEDC